MLGELYLDAILQLLSGTNKNTLYEKNPKFYSLCQNIRLYMCGNLHCASRILFHYQIIVILFSDHDRSTMGIKTCVTSPLSRMTSSHSFRGQGHFSHHRNSHFTTTSKIHHHHSNHHSNHITKDNYSLRDGQKPSSSGGDHMNSVIRTQTHKLSSPPPHSSAGPQSQPLNMSNKDNGPNKNQQNNHEDERPTKLTSFSVMDILSPSKFKPLGTSGKVLPAIPSLRPIHPPFMTSQIPVSHAEYLTQRQNMLLHTHVKNMQHQHQSEATVSRASGEYTRTRTF